MKNETYRIALISFILIAMVLLFSGMAFADDEKDTDDNENAVTEEQNVDTEDVDEDATAEDNEETEPVEVTYLNDLDSSDGEIELVFRLDESDGNSFFLRRYQDLWSGDDFYLGDAWYRGWGEDGSIVRLNLLNFVDPSWQGSLDWQKPGEFWAWMNLSRNRQYEIPSEFAETWRYSSFGFEVYSPCSQTWRLEYSRIEDVIRESLMETNPTDWQNDNAALRYAFELSGWNGSVEFSQRSYDDRTGDINDTEHTTGLLRAGRNFGDSNYMEGNVLYSVADVHEGDDLKTLHLGGYGRFVNALGIDRFNVTSHVGWDNRTDGPSRLHPIGDEFNFDIGARWRPAPEISLYGSWNYQKEDVTHGDQYTIYQYRFDPMGPDPEHGLLMTSNVDADKWNAGGRWDVADGLDFNVDFTWLDRGGLPLTDLIYAESPSLFWESETDFKYSLRYHHGTAADTVSGDWLLMYETHNRDNSARDSKTSSEHLSINWTGNLDPDVWVYAGGGYLRTDNDYMGAEMVDQDGTEYGGGWNWDMAEDWELYGDYWRYNVDGQWGYDQTSFLAGLGHDFDENWELAVEYNSVKGDFDDLTVLDYDFNELLMRFSYSW